MTVTDISLVTMETTKITKVAEVRPLPRTDTSSRNIKQTPRILSQPNLTWYAVLLLK